MSILYASLFLNAVKWVKLCSEVVLSLIMLYWVNVLAHLRGQDVAGN